MPQPDHSDNLDGGMHYAPQKVQRLCGRGMRTLHAPFLQHRRRHASHSSALPIDGNHESRLALARAWHELLIRKADHGTSVQKEEPWRRFSRNGYHLQESQ
jgi:hypothetical protein